MSIARCDHGYKLTHVGGPDGYLHSYALDCPHCTRGEPSVPPIKRTPEPTADDVKEIT